jgi:hypothetical protein
MMSGSRAELSYANGRDALIRKGLLKADARNDLRAVREALYEYLDRTLGAMPDAQWGDAQ